MVQALRGPGHPVCHRPPDQPQALPWACLRCLEGRALAEAKSLDEVKTIVDKAIAIKEYARQAKNRQLEVDAAEIRIRAERRLGEMLIETEKNRGVIGAPGPGRGKKNAVPKENRVLSPTLSSMGIDKKLSSRAQKLAAVPEQKFEGMMGEWKEKLHKENERVTVNLLREGERAQRDEGLQAKREMPEGVYDVIYADPPWKYGFSETTSRDIENQYPTMEVEEIKALDVPSADNSVLLLWATAPKLKEALEVMEAWGFEYKTHAVWDKEKIGMGYWFRGQHELLLVGTKGKMPPPDPEHRVSSVFREARGKHSKKPEVVYSWIEAAFKDKVKLEMYCRSLRTAWLTWGNESDA